MRCTIFTFIRRLFTTKTDETTPQNPESQLKTDGLTSSHPEQSTTSPVVSSAPSAVPRIYTRAEHTLSRKNINTNALKVLQRLTKAGFNAYLVGGCVRDLLLNKAPKDFDIATDATPEQVKALFRNSRLIGRRFRLAHILFGREIIEVATFRGPANGNLDQDKQQIATTESGMLLRDNVYGTLEEDAVRRDFTLNSLYYDVRDFTIRDYCNGMADLKAGIIRLIGDPETRYREDPVRMIRALRFVAKLNFTLAPETEAPIAHLVPLLKQVPNARLFDEALKLLQTGQGYHSFKLLAQYDIVPLFFPSLVGVHLSDRTHTVKMINAALKNTDLRIAQQKKVNPAFLYAAILWYPLTEMARAIGNESGLSYHDAFNLAISDILSEQCKATGIPKRITAIITDIWHLQLRLSRLTPSKIQATFEHLKFRAGYDLLLLRAKIESGKTAQLAQWWSDYQTANENEQAKLRSTASALIDKRPTKQRKKHTKTSPAIHKKDGHRDSTF